MQGKVQLTWCWKWRSGFFSLSWSSILASRSLCSFVSLLSVYSFCQLLVPLSFLASSSGFGSWCWRRGSRWWCWSSLRFSKLLPLVLFAFSSLVFHLLTVFVFWRWRRSWGTLAFCSLPLFLSLSRLLLQSSPLLSVFFLCSCLFLVPCSGSPLLSVFPKFFSVSPPGLLRSLFSAVRGSFFVSLPLSFPSFFSLFAWLFRVPLFFFLFSPCALIFSGFIAREYQPFEMASLYSSNGSWGGRRRRRLINSKTAPFVWWEYPFSIWSLKFWNHVIESLGKL